jgi:hypothetical protein
MFCGSARTVGLLKLAALATALLAMSAFAGTMQAVGMALPSWSRGVAMLLPLAPLFTVFWTLGVLGFLATAWRVENAMRFPATGWTWALACALVVSIGGWRLRAAPAPSSLDAYVSYARIGPYAMLMSYVVLAASLASFAMPCLRLRRRLVGAPGPSAPAQPPLVHAFQLHAACLEGKLALAMGLAVLGCCGMLPSVASVQSGHAWERVFVAGDVALDLLGLLAMTRFVRVATGPVWLIASLIVRAPLLVDASHQGWTIDLLFVFAGVVVALVGHAKIARWLGGQVEPFCLRKSRDAYRDATRFLLAALSVLAGTALLLGSKMFFVVIAAPTAIVAVRLLRRHVEAALVALKEAEDGSSM